MPDTELLKLTISELAPKIKAREVSPVEVVEAALAQADRLQPSINSFITIARDEARRQAHEQEAALARGDYRGPLQGIPIGLKDNIATAGIRTTVGSKVMADYVPEEDAHVVSLCKEAGAIILGKENLHEFASGGSSNNPHYGAVRNPWAVDHSPGGSSGGGGANVAACVTFASLGTDLGGSVRHPASQCGVVGLKQTFGRVSQRGLLATVFNGDHIGPITRSAQDSALVLQVIAGHDPLEPSTVPVPVPDYSAGIGSGLHGLKMGVPTNHYFDLVEPEVEAAVRQAIGALGELGVDIQEVTLPSMRYYGALRIALMADRLVNNEPYIRGHRSDYGPDVLYTALAGQFVLGRDYAKSMKVQRLIKEEHARVLQEVDFLVSPTMPMPAPLIGITTFTSGGKEYRMGDGPGSGASGRITGPANATGLPAISVPCGFTQSGLPIGLQFMGRPFEEALLFRVAHAYEPVSPSQGLRPSLADG